MDFYAQYLCFALITVILCYVPYYILAFHWHISLKGKAILITGCDTGIGNYTAKALDKMGCIVFATCLNSATAQALDKDTSPNTITKIMDVTNTDQIKIVCNEISDYLNSKHQCLLGIVNNAGIIELSPFECISPDTFNKVISVNFTGTVNITRAFLPLMRSSEHNQYLNTNKFGTKYLGLWNRGRAGRIVNVASVAGSAPAPFFSAYACSKYAVMGFSECLRLELNNLFNIWVSTVEPSFTNTRIYTNGTSAGERARTTWRQLDNGKEMMKAYNLESFVHCLEHGYNICGVNNDVNKVVNVIIAGLRSKFPLKHYYPTYSAALLVKLNELLPSFLSEMLTEKIFISKT